MRRRGRAASGVTEISVDLRIGGQPLHADVAVPAGPARMVDILPALRVLADSVVDAACAASRAEGRQVTCRKGCDACCYQLVPLMQAEAAALPDLVAALPAPLRARIEQRLASALQRLEGAGMLDRLLHPDRCSAEEMDAVAGQYFAVGAACPFLERGICTIHDHRPLACRQYVVTSPREECSRPMTGGVRRMPLAAYVSDAAERLDAEMSDRPGQWVPLVVALLAPPAAGTAAPDGTSLLREVFRRLAAPAA